MAKAKPKAKPKAKATPAARRMKEPDRWFDTRLQLALLDEVFTNTDREIDELEATYKKQAKGKRAPSWDDVAEQSEPRHNKLLEQILLAQPLAARDLAAIEDLTLDGDRELYAWVFPFWWDFGSHFRIRDLRDLARCPGLTSLHLGQGLVEGCSLAALEDLPRLRELSLCTTGRYKDIEALLDLPSLEVIEVVNQTTQDAARWRKTLDQLAARGVTQKS